MGLPKYGLTFSTVNLTPTLTTNFPLHGLNTNKLPFLKPQLFQPLTLNPDIRNRRTSPDINNTPSLIGSRYFNLPKGWSQSDLARACNKDRQAIEIIENGKVNPTIYSLYEIAKALEVTLPTLLQI